MLWCSWVFRVHWSSFANALCARTCITVFTQIVIKFNFSSHVSPLRSCNNNCFVCFRWRWDFLFANQLMHGITTKSVFNSSLMIAVVCWVNFKIFFYFSFDLMCVFIISLLPFLLRLFDFIYVLILFFFYFAFLLNIRFTAIRSLRCFSAIRIA